MITLLSKIFLIINLLDAILTYFVISNGIGYEGNTILMSYLIEINWGLFFLVKLLLGLLLIYIALQTPITIKNKLIGFFCTIFSLITINNLLVYMRII